MRKLWVRLTGAFLLVALLAVLVMAFFIDRAVELGFRGYVGRENAQLTTTALLEELETYYAEHGTWDGAEALFPGQRGQGRGGGERRGEGGPGGVSYVLFDAAGRAVAGEGDHQGEMASNGELDTALPLHQGNEVVGWLLIETPGQATLDSTQIRFLEEVRQALIGVTLLAGAVALVVGIAISGILSRPLRRLTEAAQAVASGELGRRVEINRHQPAEFTMLAESFNGMSHALAEGEALRQRMAADIAHELRTPISVMRSQLQAMLDGVYPTDTGHVAVVYEQTLHLARLVDDLRMLTQAETGHLPLEMRSLRPANLIARAATLFEPMARDAGLNLRTDVEDNLPEVSGDQDRLHQVLANLLANALRHTETGGEIRLQGKSTGNGVRFTIVNSGETLTQEQAEHIFERFWRADESRQRDRGGAGLGLAITRQLVRLHGGRIWVEVGGGETCVVFELPAAT